MICERCHSTHFQRKNIDHVFYRHGEPVLVKEIPAMVCDQCGELTFDASTAEKIRVLLHGKTKPVSKIEMDVFALA